MKNIHLFIFLKFVTVVTLLSCATRNSSQWSKGESNVESKLMEMQSDKYWLELSPIKSNDSSQQQGVVDLVRINADGTEDRIEALKQADDTQLVLTVKISKDENVSNSNQQQPAARKNTKWLNIFLCAMALQLCFSSYVEIGQFQQTQNKVLTECLESVFVFDSRGCPSETVCTALEQTPQEEQHPELRSACESCESDAVLDCKDSATGAARKTLIYPIVTASGALVMGSLIIFRKFSKSKQLPVPPMDDIVRQLFQKNPKTIKISSIPETLRLLAKQTNSQINPEIQKFAPELNWNP